MVSRKCLNAIEGFEGFRAKAYKDFARGVLTIGFGRTQGVSIDDECTRPQAEVWLIEDTSIRQHEILQFVKVPLVDYEMAALVSFAYNEGMGAERDSTLVKLLNEGKKSLAANEFGKWNKAKVNGVMVAVPGLTRRRTWERASFLNEI